MSVSSDPLSALNHLNAIRLDWSRPKTMGWQDILPALERLRPPGAPRSAPQARSNPPRPNYATPAPYVAPRPASHLPECPYCTRKHTGPCPTQLAASQQGQHCCPYWGSHPNQPCTARRTPWR
jgi:hypothetical protein